MEEIKKLLEEFYGYAVKIDLYEGCDFIQREKDRNEAIQKFLEDKKEGIDKVLKTQYDKGYRDCHIEWTYWNKDRIH